MKLCYNSLMINTYNESNLHRTLKNLYALEFNGKTEVPVENWICDIVAEDDEIIEIQTANISALTEKTRALLASGKKVRIVHPLVTEKLIETYTPDGSLTSRRKSPKVQTIYAVLRSLTGIYPLLLNENFTLEVIHVSITERRRKTAAPVQLANRSRRFLKDWVPQGKELNRIAEKMRFRTKEDYLSLIPPSVETEFSVPELQKAIFARAWGEDLSKSNRTKAAAQARLLIWLFKRMGLVEECGKQGRSKLYRILGASSGK